MTTNDIIVGQLYTHRGIDATFGEGTVYLGCGSYDKTSTRFVKKFLVIYKCPYKNYPPGTKVIPECAFWHKFQPYNPKP